MSEALDKLIEQMIEAGLQEPEILELFAQAEELGENEEIEIDEDKKEWLEKVLEIFEAEGETEAEMEPEADNVAAEIIAAIVDEQPLKVGELYESAIKQRAGVMVEDYKTYIAQNLLAEETEVEETEETEVEATEEEGELDVEALQKEEAELIASLKEQGLNEEEIEYLLSLEDEELDALLADVESDEKKNDVEEGMLSDLGNSLRSGAAKGKGLGFKPTPTSKIRTAASVAGTAALLKTKTEIK